MTVSGSRLDFLAQTNVASIFFSFLTDLILFPSFDALLFNRHAFQSCFPREQMWWSLYQTFLQLWSQIRWQTFQSYENSPIDIFGDT